MYCMRNWGETANEGGRWDGQGRKNDRFLILLSIKRKTCQEDELVLSKVCPLPTMII